MTANNVVALKKARFTLSFWDLPLIISFRWFIVFTLAFISQSVKRPFKA
jgi:hypothetical protein